MIWNILYQMTRDSELSPKLYMKIAMKALKEENDDLLLGNILGRRSNLKALYLTYLDKDERAKLSTEFEALIWNRMELAKHGSSLQMSFYDFFVSVAQSPMSVSRLFDMLVKNEPPKGITLDQDRRWALILNLSVNGHTEAMKLVEEEKKRDQSTLGKRNAYSGRAAFPLKSQKEMIWKELFNNRELTHSDLEEAGIQMATPNNPELSKPFFEMYFKKVSTINWKDNDDKVDIYFESFFPHVNCSEELQKMSQRYLERAKNLTSIARRSWKEAQDELNRCVKVRKLLPTKSDLQ
jgi:aminopeptidase N